MNTQEQLIFWPGYIKSSLAYVCRDTETNKVRKFLMNEEPSCLLKVNDKILAGKKSLELASFYDEFEICLLYTSDAADE